MPNRRFTWLLRLLPGTFREEHETELVRVWRDELRDAGDAAQGRVWLRAVADTLRVAPREFVSAWRHHLAIAARSLIKAPAFATAAIATLALGIGATTAMFSLLVLVIACANVANLLLARGVARRTELGVKVALGAGPARLAGELMAEGVVLAASGGALGLALAAWLPRIVRALDPGAVPRLEHVGLDWRVVTIMATVVVLTAALSILLPFLERLRLRSTADPLRDRSAGRSRSVARAGRALVVVQSTLATIAVVGALFLAYTFDRLQRSPLGFDPQNALTARVSVFTPSPGRTPVQFFADAVSATSRVPGVQHAGAISQLPFSGAMLGSAFLGTPGTASAATPQRIDVDLRAVTPGYFAAAAIPLASGRSFTDHDVATSVPVAIVDETFARALSVTGTVIGRRIRWLRQPDVNVEIIGVVAAVRHRNLAESPRPTVYRPLTQYPRTSMFMIARTSGDPRAMSDRVVEAIQSAGALHPISDVATMSERVSRSANRVRLSFVLAAILAATALVLGSIGLYGVLSFDVSQRRREFGVRLALGATATRVRLLVVRDGVPLVGAGLAIGITSAWILIHTATPVLYGVTPADVPPYALGALVVALCSGAALWLPIRRASAVDPAVALRQE